MNIFVVVNQVEEIGYRQTTALLIAALVRLGHTVSLAGVGEFSFDTSRAGVPLKHDLTTPFLARCKTMPARADCDSEWVDDFSKSDSPMTSQPIHAGDLILIRTNPGRDPGRSATHDAFLDLCQSAESLGIRVSNRPAQMKYLSSKASLVAVPPKFCPPMIVSDDRELIVDFIRRSNTRCVVKPLFGSRGQNVIQVKHDQHGLDSLLETAYAGVGIVAQHFVTADHLGDKRVIVLSGKVLEMDGHLAGIERHPAPDDFRANLHAGGTAHPLQLSDAARATAEFAAMFLMDRGIRLAGVDLIGDKIIEFNVFSTGGLFDAESYSGVDFSGAIAKELISFAMKQPG